MPQEKDLTPVASTRERLLRAAADLLTGGGRDAVSTRAVSAAAGVQAPTIYRLFGDKAGLLNAVANQEFQTYLADKQARAETDDPVADLRRAWDLHVEFGLSTPAVYTLMYGEAREQESPAGRAALEILRHKIRRVGAAGRLRVSAERATRLTHANGIGVVLSLIATPPAERDGELPVIVREQVLRTITIEHGGPSAAESDVPDGPSGLRVRAAALRESLRVEGTSTLSPAEGALLVEWLDRLADATETGSPRAIPRRV